MRINFQSSVGDGYAIAKDYESPVEAVGRSIARRAQGHYRNAREDSRAANGAYTTYQITVTDRKPRYSGDSVPFRNIWTTIYW